MCPIARKSALVGVVPCFAVVGAPQANAGHFVLADVMDLIHYRACDPFDLLVALGTVEHDLRGAKLIAAMHDRHLGGELRQKRRLLHRGIHRLPQPSPACREKRTRRK